MIILSRSCNKKWIIFLFTCIIAIGLYLKLKKHYFTRVLSVGEEYIIPYPSKCELSVSANNGVLEDTVRGIDKGIQVLALKEGISQILCNDTIYDVVVVKPSVLKILFFDDNITHQKTIKSLYIDKEYHIAGRLFDSQQREVETPEFIKFNIEVSDNIYNDFKRSAKEFGLCPKCFGQFYIKPKALGKYKVKLSYHGLEAELYGEVVPE